MSENLNKGHDITSFLTLDSLNPCIFDVKYAVRGPIVARADEIEEELKKGIEKPFKKIIKANIGDCQKFRIGPLTFFRQVTAACIYPDHIENNIFPTDVTLRAKTILTAMGGTIGSYTHSLGTSYIRQRVANFIERRDGYSSSLSNIILIGGASPGIKTLIYSLTKIHKDGKKSGIMVPIPQYPLYSATIAEFGGVLIDYYLDEDKNWQLDISECERAYSESIGHSVPKAMVVINPGNPSGQVLSYQNMVEIVNFCAQKKLILMADEVYQENIYDSESKFTSFKKVVNDLGFTEHNFVLVSFNSISKGFYTECGLRGGYMELFGFTEDIKERLTTLFSAQLCPSSIGQVVVEAMTNPPVSGDASFPTYINERSEILGSLATKAQLLFSEFNSIPGITCNKIQGALYGFPRLHFDNNFISEAQNQCLEPDEYYCRLLLEETGICVVPGSGFKQRPGTYHFRTTILPPLSDIKYMVEKIKEFNTKIFASYN